MYGHENFRRFALENQGIDPLSNADWGGRSLPNGLKKSGATFLPHAFRALGESPRVAASPGAMSLQPR